MPILVLSSFTLDEVWVFVLPPNACPCALPPMQHVLPAFRQRFASCFRFAHTARRRLFTCPPPPCPSCLRLFLAPSDSRSKSNIVTTQTEQEELDPDTFLGAPPHVMEEVLRFIRVRRDSIFLPGVPLRFNARRQACRVRRSTCRPSVRNPRFTLTNQQVSFSALTS